MKVPVALAEHMFLMLLLVALVDQEEMTVRMEKLLVTVLLLQATMIIYMVAVVLLEVMVTVLREELLVP